MRVLEGKKSSSIYSFYKFHTFEVKSQVRRLHKIQQIISEMLRIIDQTAHRHVYLILLYELQNSS